MANLLNQNIGTNYKGILNLGSTINTALSSTLRAITDGDGVASPLQLSTTSVYINSALTILNEFTLSGNIIRSGRGRISWYSGDGNMTLTNSTENGFGLLNFGGLTNAFPALKRNGAALEVRLADDSDFSSLWASSIRSKLFQANNGNNNGRVSLQTWNNMILNVEDGGVAIASGSFLSPNASAILQADSTTRGFLPPRGTNTQMLAIATPATGLMFYDTTNNRLNVYDGTNWISLH